MQFPLGVDMLTQQWWSVPKYAFPTVKIMHLVVGKMRKERESVLLYPFSQPVSFLNRNVFTLLKGGFWVENISSTLALKTCWS